MQLKKVQVLSEQLHVVKKKLGILFQMILKLWAG